MNMIKKTFGKLLYGIGRFFDVVLGFIVDILDAISASIKTIGRALLRIVGTGLMILFFFMFSGLILGILLLPTIIRLLFIFIVIPYLVELLSRVLKILRYVLTEYFYDKADYFIDGNQAKFNSIVDYFREYIRKEEEKKRQAEEARRRAEQRQREEQQRQWEDFFKNATGWSSYTGGFQQTGGGGSTNRNYGSMNIGFKEQYEKSCDILGVDYRADKDQIRTAYRKKAKEYHPDLNKAEDATRKFQEVNDAHEFLNEENMDYYNKMF